MPINFSGAYTQSFDTLASSGTNNPWTNNVTLPGWFLFRQPSPGTEITSYNANSGNATTGNFISYGATDASDRALGALGSGGAYFGSPAAESVAGWIAFAATNTTGATLTTLAVAFDGEQWRNGGNATAQTMVLEYGFGETFAAVTTWTAPGNTFDWTSPIATTTAGAVDGNGTGLVANRGGTLDNLTWVADSTLWFRWIERNDAGNDHGLAIDNFSLTATVPSPPLPTVTLSVSTNAGSEAAQAMVIVTATASSAVSGLQTVTLNVTGAGITAEDYSLSSATIAILDGQTTGTVTFTIQDDARVEGTEIVTLTLSDPSSGIALGDTLTQTITIADNDTPGVVITESGDTTTVTEGGATDTYTVVLTSQPTANVAIALNPDSQLSLDTTLLTFTPENWNVAQVVTVAAIDDSAVEGAHTGNIAHIATSADADYNGLAIATLTAAITDNDASPPAVEPVLSGLGGRHTLSSPCEIPRPSTTLGGQAQPTDPAPPSGQKLTPCNLWALG